MRGSVADCARIVTAVEHIQDIQKGQLAGQDCFGNWIDLGEVGMFLPPNEWILVQTVNFEAGIVQEVGSGQACSSKFEKGIVKVGSAV
jgi:hypothetical protein